MAPPDPSSIAFVTKVPPKLGALDQPLHSSEIFFEKLQYFKSFQIYFSNNVQVDAQNAKVICKSLLH